MKKLLILFLIVQLLSCTKETFDLKHITSVDDITVFIDQLKTNNIAVDSSSSLYDYSIESDQLRYNNAPIKSVEFKKQSFKIYADSTDFSAINLLKALEDEHGLGSKKDTYYDEDVTSLIWTKEKQNIELEYTHKAESHLAKPAPNDDAEVRFEFLKSYNTGLGKLHNAIKTFDDNTSYSLEIEYSASYIKMYLNDIYLTSDSKGNTYTSSGFSFDINRFLKNNTPNTLKIEIFNGKGNRVKQPEVFARILKHNTYVAYNQNAKLDAEVVSTEQQFITKNKQEIEINFTPQLPVSAWKWTIGKDLKQQKNLKQKVTKLYQQLAKAIETKDVELLDTLLYDAYLEERQASYDNSYNTSREDMAFWEEVMDETYKVSVSKDFDIDILSDGKLMLPIANDLSDMIVFTGKETYEAKSFYLYMPKDGNDLKIIRD